MCYDYFGKKIYSYVTRIFENRAFTKAADSIALGGEYQNL
jgi:hypothetical protein